MSAQEKINPKRIANFIWIGVFFCALYWVLESIRDMMIYEEGSVFKWIFVPSAMSFWMRVLVICIIMLFSAYTQSIRQKSEEKKMGLEIFEKMNIVWIGLTFGLLYWVLEAFRDVVVFHKGSFLKQIFFPDAMGFWMRLLAVCILILFSLYLKTLANERKATEAKLREMREQLLKETGSRSSEMTHAIEDLQKKIKTHETDEKELLKLVREKESLLRGVHQSIKHNLQHLNSLFDMRIMETENRSQIEMYTELRTLLYTLTLIHSQLYNTDRFNRINLNTFLHGLKDYLMHLYPGGEIKFYFDDNELIVPTYQAVPCALVISELIFLSIQQTGNKDKKEPFHIFLKRSGDNTLSIKIRYHDSKILTGVEDKKPVKANYKWIHELVREQLRGDFWVVRNPHTIEINYDFEVKM